MARARPYYSEKGLSTRFYDLVTGADPRLAGDVDIYARLAGDGPVLELGAGSGRVAAALAARGLSVTGVDLSPAMLARARARLAALPPEVAARIELRQGDMTSLDLKRTFALVACSFFTLAHVPVGAAWRNTFAAIARHLAPGGRAAIHLPRIEVMSLPGPAHPGMPVLSLALDGGRRLELFVRERLFRPEFGRLEQVIDYVVSDAQGRCVESSPERLTYYMADPRPFAAAAELAPDGPPVDVGGVGDIHVFVKG